MKMSLILLKLRYALSAMLFAIFYVIRTLSKHKERVKFTYDFFYLDVPIF